MLVRELMERTSISNFGLARMFIEDGLLEMSIQQAPWQREITMSIVKDQRFYYFPQDCIKVMDIMVRNHMNSKGEYRSISRLLNEPMIKDISKSEGNLNDGGKISDLNKGINNTNETFYLTGSESTDVTGSREYGYYIKGNKLSIVEKAVATDPNADVINDTNAYQRSDNTWRTPGVSNIGGIKIVYAYNPTYYINKLGLGATSALTNHTGISHFIPAGSTALTTAPVWPSNTEFVIQLATFESAKTATSITDYAAYNVDSGDKGSNWSAGKWIYVEDLGFWSGLWEITQTAAADHADVGEEAGKAQIGVRRPVNWLKGQVPETTETLGGPVPIINVYNLNRTPIAVTNINSLYTDREDFNLPITDLQGSSLMCYIKSQIALESGNIELKMYYDKEFKRKLAQQETAYVSGPRMISSGPFALKR